MPLWSFSTKPSGNTVIVINYAWVKVSRGYWISHFFLYNEKNFFLYNDKNVISSKLELGIIEMYFPTFYKPIINDHKANLWSLNYLSMIIYPKSSNGFYIFNLILGKFDGILCNTLNSISLNLCIFYIVYSNFATQYLQLIYSDILFMF